MTKRIATIVMSGLTLIAGCGRDEIIPVDAVQPPDSAPPPVIDGPTIDAFSTVCSSAAATADITATGGGGGTVHYGRLYAGAVWEIGPVAPPAAGPTAPMTMSVLFIDTDPLDASTAGCCLAGDDACCGAPSLFGYTGSIAAGAEVGDHAVTFTKSDNAAYTVPGTLTITTFQDPFPTAPGRIAGSISGSMAGRTVTGTFDNAFCPALLTATI